MILSCLGVSSIESLLRRRLKNSKSDERPNGWLCTSVQVATIGLVYSGLRERVNQCRNSYLVDPASSHMLVSKIKPCMSKYKQICTVKLRMAH